MPRARSQKHCRKTSPPDQPVPPVYLPPSVCRCKKCSKPFLSCARPPGRGVEYRVLRPPSRRGSVLPPLVPPTVAAGFIVLARGRPLAGQRLLVPLLHLNVAALQLQRPRQRAARAHPREVLGGVDREHVAQDLGDDGGGATDMKVGRVDSHEHEAEAVVAMRPT